MKNLKAIKTATICMFLLINIPYDHISPFLFMLIPFLFLNYFGEIISFYQNFYESFISFLNLLFIILIILSFIKIFETKKIWIALSLIIQYIFLVYIFKTTFLKHWLFYIPTCIYLLLSLYLIMELFVLKTRNTNK